MEQTEFLIVGAGPYGLAAAAYAKSNGVDAIVVGRPLDLWKSGMPRGMFLRSGPDWHLDGREVATFEAYVKERGLTPRETKPLPIDIFLDYVSWFMGRYDITPRNAHVMHLARAVAGAYIATLDDGSRISAANVLLALGFGFFKHLPHEVISKLPPRSYSHTADSVDFDYYRKKRVLIVGGRQSAYDWAALIRERGADQIYLTHRHAKPRFVEPDWSWVQPMVRRTLVDHSWWRRLPIKEQVRIVDDFWPTGRLTLEPWLDERVHQPNVHIHERTSIVSVDEDGQGLCMANSKMLRKLAIRHAQRGEELRFTFETREPFGVERELRWQDLQRDLATELQIARAKNLAHSARTERREDFVRTETAATGQRHRRVPAVTRPTWPTCLTRLTWALRGTDPASPACPSRRARTETRGRRRRARVACPCPAYQAGGTSAAASSRWGR
jgi:FAD-dependent urate hydroxylase